MAKPKINVYGREDEETKGLIDQLRAAPETPEVPVEAPVREKPAMPLMEFPDAPEAVAAPARVNSGRGFLDALRDPRNADEASNQRAMLLGATPLLIGLLAGDTRAGAGVAAKGLLGEDQRRLKEQELEKKLVAKRKAASKSGRLYKIRKGDEIRYGREEDAYGKLAPRPRRTLEESIDVARGTTEAREKSKREGGVYGRKVLKDDQGREYVVNVAEPTEKQKIFEDTDQDVSPVFMKKRDARYGKLSERNKKDIEAIRTAKKGLAVLKTDGLMPKAVAMNMAVKITEARATDEDYNRVIKNVSKIRRIREALKEEKNGQIAERKTKEAHNLFEEILKVAGSVVEQDVQKGARAISKTEAQYQNALKHFSDLIPGYKKEFNASEFYKSLKNLSSEEKRAKMKALPREQQNELLKVIE